MKVCIIGASRGIGKELTKELLASGHAVWAIARTTSDLESAAAEYPSLPFFWSIADIRNGASLRQSHEQMQRKNFEPDAVVLNASIQIADFSDAGYDVAAADSVIRTNLLGVLSCVHEFLPEFLSRTQGIFLLVSSTTSLRPSSISASYAAAKAGASMAFRSFALRYSRRGVTFKIATLGPIQTDMWEGRHSVLVPSPASAAKALVGFLDSKRKTLHYPFVTTTLLRFTLWFPDAFFALVSRTFLQ